MKQYKMNVTSQFQGIVEANSKEEAIMIASDLCATEDVFECEEVQE